MTELSALAGSEGYAACDDEASVELSAKGGQPRRRAQRRSPSDARGRGTLLSKKAVEAFFDSPDPPVRKLVDFFARSEAQSHRVATGGAELLLCDKRSGLLVLAGLVGDAAAGLAGALAGGLAFAAAALDGALAEVAGFEGLYPFHFNTLLCIRLARKGGILLIKGYSNTANLSSKKSNSQASVFWAKKRIKYT